MPISIYQIENLFGSNETYEFPAYLPTIFLDKEEDLPLRPEMDGYYSGTIRLEGANWNGCKYEGIYYHLKRNTCLDANPDPKKEVWLYTLVRCMGTNTVLLNTVEVKGDLATGNGDDLLKTEINKCSGMVEKPVEIFRTPFLIEDPDQGRLNLVQNSEKFKPITLEPREKVLSQKMFDALQRKIIQLEGFKNADKFLYIRRKDIYIFGLIEPTVYKDGGKAKAIKKINEAHKNIRYDSTRKLVKVTTPQNHNKLLNHYALSYSESSIGRIDNSMVLRTLDLSGVTDIVPVSGKDLEEKPAETIINEKNAVFNTGDDLSSVVGGDKPGKLARRFYAPLGKDYYFDGHTKSYPNAPRLIRNWRDSVKGQRVRCKNFFNPNYQLDSYFYGVDRVDFSLSGYRKGIYAGGDHARVNYSYYNGAYEQLRSFNYSCKALQQHPIPKYFSTVITPGDIRRNRNNGICDPHTLSMNAVPNYSIRDADTVDTIGHRMSRPPGYGVLIGQTERGGNDGDRVKYIGKGPVKKLYGYSGIHIDKFREKYSQKNEGGSNVENNELGFLCKSTTVSKFFLDLDFLLWVYFTPKVSDYDGSSSYQYPYFGDDNYGLGKYLSGGIGDRDAVKIASGVRQIINVNTGQKITPPFTNTLYPVYDNERLLKIREVLLRSELDLEKEFGKDYIIEPGDFFCSSLEYEGRQGNNSIGNPNKDFYKGLKPDFIIRAANTIQDFIEPDPDDGFGSGSHDLENELYLKDGTGVCLCSNLEGGIEIRKISGFKKQHSLAQADYQAVLSVDGETSKTITYGHLKGLGIDLSTEISSSFDTRSKNKLLTYFYKALGYKVEIEKRSNDFYGKGNGITDEMMNSPEGVLLDLVGSDGYAYLRNKKEVHFIYKYSDPSIKDDITSVSVERSVLDRRKIDARLANASITAKINQINILYFYNTPIHLKTKFLFSGVGSKDSPFYIEYKALQTKDKTADAEFYAFKAKGEWDEIDEILSVPKQSVTITEVADQFSLEEIRLHRNYEQERYENKQQFLGLDQKLIDIRAERAKFDLNTEDINKSIGFAFDMAGLAGSMAMRTYSPIADAVMSSIDSDQFDLGKKEYSLSNAYNVQPKSHIATGQTAKGIKGFGRLLRRAGLGPTMGLIQGAAKIASYAMGKNRILPEKSRRIQEDKEISSKQLALKTLEIDRSHFQAMQDYALRINYLANKHFKEGFSELDLYKEGKKAKKIDENTNIYLLTLIPSEQQLKYIEEYREHYGVQCDIPNKIITLKNGMAPNVIRFRNLDEGAILGISDLVARAGLKARLLCQVKIIDNEKSKQEYSYFDYHVVTPVLISESNTKELEEELEKTRLELAQAQKASQLNLNAFLVKLDKDRNDEATLQRDIDDLNEIKKKVEAAIAKGEEDKKEKPTLEKPYEEKDIELVNKFIKAFEDFLENIRQRKQLEADKEKAETERDKLKEDLKGAEEKEKKLTSEKDELAKKLDSTEDERDKLREQLNKAHEKERNLMNQNDDCGKKIKEYEGYIASLKDLNKTGTEFAKNLNIATSGVKLDPNRPLEGLEEVKKIQADLLNVDKQFRLQGDLIKQELDRTKTELATTKTELQKAQTEAGKCKAGARRDSTSLARQIRGGTYCDFLRAFESLQWNYMEMYKILTNAELYGFSCDEYGNLIGVPTLQAIQQTVEECEKLLEDNTDFTRYEKEKLREGLLTEEGAEKIRGMKRGFVTNWAQMGSNRATQNELIDRASGQIKRSTFYNANINFDFPKKEVQITGANNFMGYDSNNGEEKYLESPIAFKRTMEKNGPGNGGVSGIIIKKIKGARAFKDSFARAKAYGILCSASWGTNDNTGGKLDPYSNLALGSGSTYNDGTTAKQMFSRILGLFNYGFTNKYFYEKISKRSITSSDLLLRTIKAKYKNASNIEGDYQGFSNRRFFGGYLLVFLEFYYENYSIIHDTLGGGTSMEKQFEFPNLSFAKRGIRKLGMEIDEGNRKTLYPLKVAYEALCNKLSFEEAQDKIEKELEATKQQS